MADTPKVSGSKSVPEQASDPKSGSSVAEEQKPAKKQKIPFFRRISSGVKSWVSWDAVKSNSIYVADSAQSLLDVQKAKHTESFDEAMKRLNLTEEDIKDRKANFLKLAIIVGIFAVAVLSYTVYLLWQASFMSAALAFVVTLLCLGTACRYHFWYFQVKNRKLGCTLQEWFNKKISGEK